MNNLLGRFLNSILSSILGSSKAWWVEIKTSQPACTYYFGPFDSESEAHSAKGGYVEDLEQEGAQNIQLMVSLCSRPKQLTITDEWDTPVGEFSTPAFSGQP
ncbi:MULTISPECIES: DUF1816 domain-containing protein [Cyanophyceae]|uniref:DUF1816 domain-containing protein n=1 Tax=Cyanophyceae TaxID=3028117 RepID=UPI00168647DB|nr:MULTISPECIES: DUF1816 domain-containing protein [Cyanophyceae]MBD1917473.1 DUF1816 domain-containing protein [Phormidium sp. FACHB-77]MBD2029652.1 DUF1816 domain-containing protein [Phormidium sp. FACHB-322]MBD2050913.1 DUF1816 domain-containing protein [Leptolyngbya sp. FACHB-60]